MKQLKVLQPNKRIKFLSDIIVHPQPVVVTDQDVSSEHFHTDLAYAFIVNEDPKNKVDDGESVDLQWLGQLEIEKLMVAEIFPNTREVYSFIFEHCLPNWDAVDTGAYEI